MGSAGGGEEREGAVGRRGAAWEREGYGIGDKRSESVINEW